MTDQPVNPVGEVERSPVILANWSQEAFPASQQRLKGKGGGYYELVQS